MSTDCILLFDFCLATLHRKKYLLFLLRKDQGESYSRKEINMIFFPENHEGMHVCIGMCVHTHSTPKGINPVIFFKKIKTQCHSVVWESDNRPGNRN